MIDEWKSTFKNNTDRCVAKSKFQRKKRMAQLLEKVFFDFPDPQAPVKSKGNCLPNYFSLTIGCIYYLNFMFCPTFKETTECEDLRNLFPECLKTVKYIYFFNYFTRLIEIEADFAERQFQNGF